MAEIHIDIGIVDLPDDDVENLIDNLKHVLESYIEPDKRYFNWKRI